MLRPTSPRLALALTLTMLLASTCLAGCGGSALPSRHGPLASILEPDGASLGAHPRGLLARLAKLGVDRVRVNIAWAQIAPDPNSRTAPRFDAADPADYPAASWSVDDRIIRAAAAVHEPLDITVGPPAPLWATRPGVPPGTPYAAEWKPVSSPFGAFVRALGVRYSGHYIPAGSRTPLPRVSFWSIWNEPNYGVYLAPQAIDHSRVEVSPRVYRDLLDAAWKALASTGHTTRTDTILIGETAPRASSSLPGDFNGMVPLRFVRALYCVDGAFRPLRGRQAALRDCPTTAAGSARFPATNPALFQASGWADHPYPDESAPNVRTPPPAGAGWADFAALPELETTLDRSAAAYGRSPKLPVYDTEFGYQTDPPNQLFGVPFATAARYVNEAEYLSWLSPRIRTYDQYLLADPPTTGPGTFATGIERADGRPKPDLFAAFRMPLWLPETSGSAGSPLVVWGCVRPAPYAARRTGRPQRVAIELARRGSSRFRTVRVLRLRTRLGCYFVARIVFPYGGTVRLAWTGRGPTIYSRTQTITLR